MSESFKLTYNQDLGLRPELSKVDKKESVYTEDSKGNRRYRQEKSRSHNVSFELMIPDDQLDEIHHIISSGKKKSLLGRIESPKWRRPLTLRIENVYERGKELESVLPKGNS